MTTEPVKILVLPGMGDIYWVLVKLKAFLAEKGITNPLVFTWELQPQKINRSVDYIKRIPFVTYGGSWSGSQNAPEFKEVYFGNTWKVEGFGQFDYLLSCNGILRNGYSLDSFGLEKYESDWYLPLTESTIQIESRARYSKIGDYIVAYFTDDGMYAGTWLAKLPMVSIYQALYDIHKATGHKVVLSGGKWDKPFASRLQAQDKTGFMINTVGDTSVDELFGLIEQSKGMIGWCGGNTIMSTYFKKPTLIIWSNYFPNEGFYTNCVPPDSVNNWYKYKVVQHTSVDDITSSMIALCK